MKAYKCNDMDVIKEESHWVPDDSEDWWLHKPEYLF